MELLGNDFSRREETPRRPKLSHAARSPIVVLWRVAATYWIESGIRVGTVPALARVGRVVARSHWA